MNAIHINGDFISEDYQNAILNQFRLLDDFEGTDEEIIMEFIKTDLFSFQSGHWAPPDSPVWNGWWNPVFNYNKLDRNHFKQFSREELNTFLLNYVADPSFIAGSWTNTFISHMNWLEKDIDKCSSDIFFVISLEWFCKVHDMPCLKNAGIFTNIADIYSYYIMILWLDRENYLISACLLSWD